jgi:glutamate synthase domain-containing protein 2
MLRLDKYPVEIINPKIGDIRLRVLPSGQPYKQVFAPCETCGIPRWVGYIHGTARTPICLECSKVNRYSPSRNAKISQKQKINWENQEIRDRHHALYDRLKTKPLNTRGMLRWRSKPKNLALVNEHIKEALNKPDIKEKRSQAMIAYYKSPEAREKTRQANIERYKDPLEREKTGAITKKHWENPEYKDRVLKAMSLSIQATPNVPENIVLSVLNDYFPKEWGYTGNGSFIIGGKIPDFVNKNGYKYIIEVFGDYWHDPKQNKSIKHHQTAKGTIKIFSNFGFKTLILWEHEVKSLPKSELAEKIKTFFS